MKKKNRLVIGILGTPGNDGEYKVVSLISDYKNVVISKNAIPFIIPPILNIDYENIKLSEIPPLTLIDQEIYKEMVDLCDGIIIPGGSRMYNYFDFVIRYAMDKNIPILGICMGMQMIANIDNDKYSLVLNETNIEHKQPMKKYVHKVKIISDTILSSIVKKEEINVNSNHRFHVNEVNNFKVSAISEDGLIEGIESTTHRFVIGLQWHPERMIEYDEMANKIIDRFIAECKND